MSIVKPLTKLSKNDLPTAGGKGANLGALLQAGFPVPPGFCVTTDAYRVFVEANHLQEDILHACENLQVDNLAALEAASTTIRARFAGGKMHTDIANDVRLAYINLNHSITTTKGRQSPNHPMAVAVRSSATAEDLPDMSFAGQQDTYLNIVGEEALVRSVVDCWSSLWTARAIGYRARNGIDQGDVALAVVVQQMIPSEASGVLFTANPLTGKRSETVIDATLGLGEALVSGQVEPDHYIVDDGHILSKTLGAKAIAVRGLAGGGTQTIDENAANRQALPDEQILALSQLGQQAATTFGCPQDLEWAWADGQLYAIQSRPITSLYPLPERVDAGKFEVFFSFASWQGMLDPYTPLGQDALKLLASNMALLFGIKVGPDEQRVLLSAGERLFVNFTGPLSTSLGRTGISLFIQSMDSIAAQILQEVTDDPQFPRHEPRFRDWLNILRGAAPIVYNILFNLLFPRRGRIRLQNLIDHSFRCVHERYSETHAISELAQAMEETTAFVVKVHAPHLFPAVISGQIPLHALWRQTASVPDASEWVMGLTRGMPNNVTTEMDLQLWRISQVIRSDTTAAEHFSNADIPALITEFRAGMLPTAVQEAITQFLESYGLRGVGEIDLGRQRWNEDPTHIFQVLRSYLQITDERLSPEAVFTAGKEKARQAQERLVDAFRSRRFGQLKAMLIKWTARRIRELGGLRESPKFVIISLLGPLRMAMLRAGERLVADGTIQEADDLFYLHLAEIKALGAGESRDWRQLIAERRAVYEREIRRRRIPRLLLSDGTAFYESTSKLAEAGPDTLVGSPVSAGVVEGVVRVVRNPNGTQLVPGEILVCPATDPAWTPLFLAAGGLVMEVGGMVTHGSVVAREYGIPAVVGVSQATTRLTTGQRVRVNGSTGEVTIL
ncbi:MAG: phosphoenolpyruvate synthase [Anaerolineae bacterium]|nr:phosphoenolpyruvate synthase [Anaerolineae bacterium]